MDQLTVEDVAAELELSPQTIRRMVRRGQIRAVKIGKRLFIRPEELARVQAEGTTPIKLAGDRMLTRDQVKGE